MVAKVQRCRGAGGLGYRRSNLSDICNSESRDTVRWYGTTIGSMTGILWSDEG